MSDREKMEEMIRHFTGKEAKNSPPPAGDGTPGPAPEAAPRMSRDVLRRKIAADPDLPVEAGIPPAWTLCDQAYALCVEIEKLPASEQQTVCSLAASELHTALRAAPLAAPRKPSEALYNGYDAKFWWESYRALADEVERHLPQFIHEDDVAEEHIYCEAIEAAGLALRAVPSVPPKETT